ncbi:hypothetical protein [Lutimonas vermicola]|uniref:Uncharacterized protein n=1 Tax=Lutimonas vermicola TaxID=414288 RepID=A0ABU9KXH1_9FLAO
MTKKPRGTSGTSIPGSSFAAGGAISSFCCTSGSDGSSVLILLQPAMSIIKTAKRVVFL